MASGQEKARPTQSAPDREVDEERTYSEEELREVAHSKLDCSPHAIAGALAGSSRKTHTLGQAQDAVEKFLRRKVGP